MEKVSWSIASQLVDIESPGDFNQVSVQVYMQSNWLWLSFLFQSQRAKYLFIDTPQQVLLWQGNYLR
jgi:hypothetical protein